MLNVNSLDTPIQKKDIRRMGLRNHDPTIYCLKKNSKIMLWANSKFKNQNK
jgi:hypothetical protein